MVTNYERGVVVERKCRDELASRGYTVFRTAGSHSPIDLIAVKREDLLLVQVKRTRSNKPRYTADIRTLGSVDSTGDKVLAVWVDHHGWYQWISVNSGTIQIFSTPKDFFEWLQKKKG